ncbi:MAG: hypothetical protein Q8R57_04870, partial [Bacteroidota bacterium]|nr:hypothetical protein [Bacteroidota bacterium]
SNKTISTGADAGSVGAGADIYIGKSQNITFGLSDVIKLLDTATCRVKSNELGTDVCTGPILNGYRIGKGNGLTMGLGAINSTFIYTQDEILTLVIPELELIRNQVLTGGSLNARGERKYTPVFSNPDDPDFARKFGSNNDDPIWGALRSSATPLFSESSDFIGESYIFNPTHPYEQDSIRFYNNQIRLWKEAIAKNEREKYASLQKMAASGGSNISIGKAAYTEDFSAQIDETSSSSWEVNTNRSLAGETGFDVDGSGLKRSWSLTLDLKGGKSSSSTTSVVNTFSYTLQDGDDGDLISVDIVDPKSGNGHVFKLVAGRTSCPYEGEERSLFYSPLNDTITATTLLSEGVILQNATAQNDLPVINVQQSSVVNVPAKDQAVFVVELGNASQGRQDRTYSFRVNQASNPYGAIIKIDGLDPNRDFDVPFGTSIQKTLTVERGPVHYDYDNIQLILSSPCDGDIFDTVSISAKFLPTCTGVNLKSPDDRWVLNNSF